MVALYSSYIDFSFVFYVVLCWCLFWLKYYFFLLQTVGNWNGKKKNAVGFVVNLEASDISLQGLCPIHMFCITISYTYCLWLAMVKVHILVSDYIRNWKLAQKMYFKIQFSDQTARKIWMWQYFVHLFNNYLLDDWNLVVVANRVFTQEVKFHHKLFPIQLLVQGDVLKPKRAATDCVRSLALLFFITSSQCQLLVYGPNKKKKFKEKKIVLSHTKTRNTLKNTDIRWSK